MRTQDIVIGETYRHYSNPNYGYAKVLKIIKPMANYAKKFAGLTDAEMNIRKTTIKVAWTVDKNDSFGFIKYFRPCDLVRDK